MTVTFTLTMFALFVFANTILLFTFVQLKLVWRVEIKFPPVKCYHPLGDGQCPTPRPNHRVGRTQYRYLVGKPARIQRIGPPRLDPVQLPLHTPIGECQPSPSTPIIRLLIRQRRFRRRSQRQIQRCIERIPPVLRHGRGAHRQLHLLSVSKQSRCRHHRPVVLHRQCPIPIPGRTRTGPVGRREHHRVGP